MPIIKSAIKAMKQTTKAKKRNQATKADFRGKVKAVRKDLEGAEKTLAAAVQAIDKAAKKGVLHKKAAARRKSRLMLAANKAVGKAVVTKAVKAKSDKPVAKTAAKPAVKKSTTTATKKTTKKEA